MLRHCLNCRPSPLPDFLSPLHSSVGRIRSQWTTRRLLWVIWIVLVTSVESLAGQAAVDLNRKAEEIVKQVLPPNFSITLQVADLETGRVLMAKNPHLPLVPASTMKVVTTATALKTLNPDFTFVTEVLADYTGESSVGNIYLRGMGDPYLVTEELFALTRSITEKGLAEVRGDIVVDDSYLIPGKPLDEAERLGSRSYHAPYGALSLNFNSIKLVVLPDKVPGRSARIIVDPISDYALVKGAVKTVKGKSPAQLEIVKGTNGDDKETITVTGEIGAQAPVKGRYVNVSAPALYTGEVFKEFLLREGIRVSGKVVHGKTPQSAEPYVEFSSRPLGSIVYWLNKFSNNFMAEQLCLVLGARVHGAPGTREKGLSVIRKHLLACGVDEGEFSLSEASGLSRNNRISASALVKVLLAAAHDFDYSAEFMSSLSVAGVDGTMKEKFTDPEAKRRLRAKTGTLKGVNALAGYGISPDGKTFAFAVMVNSMRQGTGLIDYADKIARAILELPLGGSEAQSPSGK